MGHFAAVLLAAENVEIDLPIWVGVSHVSCDWRREESVTASSTSGAIEPVGVWCRSHRPFLVTQSVSDTVALDDEALSKTQRY
jgi:hypothetical protein